MFITSDYNLSQLFINKKVTIYLKEDEQSFKILNQFKLVLPSLRQIILDNDLRLVYDLITSTKLREIFKDDEKSDLFLLRMLLLEMGKYDKFRSLYDLCLKELPKIIPGFSANFNSTELKINNITITDDIWDYVIYVLKLSNGEKVQKPLHFENEDARKFYLAQKANELKMEKIRQKGRQTDQDGDSIMKILLSITYSFPSMRIDYLFDQTMAQIQWLQKKAAGAVSYEVNAQAYAAGNIKKGKKLDFFIK